MGGLREMTSCSYFFLFFVSICGIHNTSTHIYEQGFTTCQFELTNNIYFSRRLWPQLHIIQPIYMHIYLFNLLWLLNLNASSKQVKTFIFPLKHLIEPVPGAPVWHGHHMCTLYYRNTSLPFTTVDNPYEWGYSSCFSQDAHTPVL